MKRVYYLLLVLPMLSQCNQEPEIDCTLVDCSSGIFLIFEIQENGENILSRNELPEFSLTIGNRNGLISISPGTEQFNLLIESDEDHILMIDNRSIIISSNFEIGPMGVCCRSFSFTEVSFDDQLVCLDNCTDLFTFDL